MPRPFASTVLLTPDARARLEARAHARATPQALALRCKIVLAAADDVPNLEIADEPGCDRHTVGQWRQRFVEVGLEGLQDLPRSGRPRKWSPR